MRFINLYNFQTLGKNLYKIFLTMLVLFITSAFLTQLFLKYNPSLIPNFKELSSEMMKKIGTLDGTYLESFVDTLLSNLRVSILVIIIGLVPNLYLSALVPIYNGIVIGILFAALEIKEKSVLVYIFLGLIPHGVLEVFAILYATSIGIYFTKNVFIFKKNSKKEDLPPQDDTSKVSNINYNNIIVAVNTSEYNPHKYDYKVYLKDIIPELIKSYVLIIIPLLVTAALIETYITPELLSLCKWW